MRVLKDLRLQTLQKGIRVGHLWEKFFLCLKLGGMNTATATP
jgi:hypothetical protein